MQEKSIFQYFSKGFTLANKSWDLFFISIIFSTFNYLPNYIPQLQGFFYFLATTLFFASFSFSLPIFMVQKQQQHLSYSKMFGVLIDNVMRLIIPGIILVAAFFILLILSVLTVIVLRIPQSQLSEFAQNIFETNWLLFLLLGVLFAPLSFAPYFFSLENKGFFASCKQSIQTAFKHLPFVSVLALINMIFYPLSGFLPKDFWGQVINTVLSGYIIIFLTATTLYYYQVNIKEKVSSLRL